MAPKKKVVRNSYYFFMIEFKEREEARGRSFPNGLRDVAVAADPEWKKLTVNEKKPYEVMAKQWKTEQRQTTDKYTTLGTCFQAVDERRRRVEEEKSMMDQTIENEIESLQTKEDLMDKSFYLMHVNYYCQLEGTTGLPSDVYIPAEIAIVEFNLQFGVLREYHIFVRARIPSGYAFSAKQHAEETHEIPVDFAKGEQDLLKILFDIKSFLMQGQTSRILPPLYTMPDNRNLNTSYGAVKSTLRHLCEASVSEENLDIFRVFVLGKLFHELICASRKYDPTTFNEQKLPQTLAENDLELDNFNYWPGFSCDFHEEIDRTLYCSLSVVKRWAYTVCGRCCKHLGITLIPGKHCPVQHCTDGRSNRDNWREVSKKERPEYRGSESLKSQGKYRKSSATDDGIEIRGSGERLDSCEASNYDNENYEDEALEKSDFASYLDSVKSQSITSRPTKTCWAAVSNASATSRQEHKFTEDEFPAIGELSLSDSRNRHQVPSNPPTAAGVLSMVSFPVIGRGRSQLGRGGLGRGRGGAL